MLEILGKKEKQELLARDFDIDVASKKPQIKDSKKELNIGVKLIQQILWKYSCHQYQMGEWHP